MADLPFDLRLTSITAYRGVEFKTDVDSDFTEAPGVLAEVREDQEQFSQEFQLHGANGDLIWVGGLFYLYENDDFKIGMQSPFFGQLMFGTPDFGMQTIASVKTNAYAAYVQGDYALNDRLSATAGIRYSYEKKSLDKIDAIFVGGFDVTFGGLTQETSVDWNAWTPKFGLQYEVSSDILVYASVTRGFKSGGFNPDPALIQSSFDPEYLWAYEAGVKSDWLDNRFRINVGAFYYDYTDLQIQRIPSEGETPGLILENASDSTIKGFEVEVTARPVPQLDLSAGVAYLDTTYKEFMTARPNAPTVPVDVSGNRLNNAPKWSINLAGQYNQNIPNYGTLSLRGEYAWQDSVFFTFFNDPVMRQDSYGFLNARVSFTTIEGHWQVAIYGHNLTDEVYYSNMADGPFGVLGQINPPKTYGVQIRYSY